MTRYERSETRIIGITVPMIAGIAQEQIAAHPGASWVRLARATAAEFAAAGVGAAIGSLIAVPGVALIMSLYHFITNCFTIPAIRAHEAQGIPFNEPPPDRQPPRKGNPL